MEDDRVAGLELVRLAEQVLDGEAFSISVAATRSPTPSGNLISGSAGMTRTSLYAPSGPLQ
jgi:hypothetical protein